MGGSILDEIRNDGELKGPALIDRICSTAIARVDPAGNAPPDVNMKKDAGKPKLALVPIIALTWVARAFEDGITRAGYLRDNWKDAKDLTRYEDALLRHFAAVQNGEEFAQDSGVPHLAHLAACALILLWHKYHKPGTQAA